MCLLVNGLILGVQRYAHPESQQTFDIVESVFITLFLIEVARALVALQPKLSKTASQTEFRS